MTRNILITGATGGLGLSLTQQFCDAGYCVTATGRNLKNKARLENMGAKFIAADLLEDSSVEHLCEGQESIIHAAALSNNWGRPTAFERTNVETTERLLEVAQRTACKRFVYISSPSIYASLHDQFAVTEQTPAASSLLNDYARTKLLAERLVLAANHAGFLTIAIRPRAIMGPDDQVLLPKMLEMLERGTVPLFRKGATLVELTDVRDVARATMLAEQKIESVAGQPINISGGKPLTMRELAEGMAAAAEKPLRFINVPMPIAKLLARMGEYSTTLSGHRHEPKLTRYILSTMAYSKTFDLSFAREKLGYTPQHDAFSTLLTETRRRTQ